MRQWINASFGSVCSSDRCLAPMCRCCGVMTRSCRSAQCSLVRWAHFSAFGLVSSSHDRTAKQAASFVGSSSFALQALYTFWIFRKTSQKVLRCGSLSHTSPLARPVPKTGAATNYATWALVCMTYYCILTEKGILHLTLLRFLYYNVLKPVCDELFTE